MFNLEQAIADWRQKMLAAGIETPVPLEELELHLREEMERQVSKGMEAQEAFDKATKSIGEAQSLKAEFKKVPEKPRHKSLRIFSSLLWFTLALMGCQNGYRRLATVNFRFAYRDGSFSYVDLLIGPGYRMYIGLIQLLCGASFIWLAWYSFRNYPKPFRQKTPN